MPRLLKYRLIARCSGIDGAASDCADTCRDTRYEDLGGFMGIEVLVFS